MATSSTGQINLYHPMPTASVEVSGIAPTVTSTPTLTATAVGTSILSSTSSSSSSSSSSHSREISFGTKPLMGEANSASSDLDLREKIENIRLAGRARMRQEITSIDMFEGFIYQRVENLAPHIVPCVPSVSLCLFRPVPLASQSILNFNSNRENFWI